MKAKSRILWGVLSSNLLLSACSHQLAKPAVTPPVAVIPVPVLPAVIAQPIVKPSNVVKVIPVPTPYRDIVVAPMQLQPVQKPFVPPVPLIKPVATLPPIVPDVRAKGDYRGAVPVDGTLREQYQQ